MRTLLASVLLILFAFIPLLLHAQGKAYDKITYTCTLKGTTIKLDYGNGYLAASEIHIIQGKNNTLLLPDSGTPEDNGDLKFTSAKQAGNGDYYIILKNISETADAPPTIRATWVNGNARSIIFRRRSH